MTTDDVSSSQPISCADLRSQHSFKQFTAICQNH